MYLRPQMHNAEGDRVVPSLGGRRTYEQASGSQATGGVRTSISQSTWCLTHLT